MGEEIAALPGVEQVLIIGPEGAPYQSGGAGSWLLPFLATEETITQA